MTMPFIAFVPNFCPRCARPYLRASVLRRVWGRTMAKRSAEQIIPLDFAEAFADAVLVYEIWSPEYPERLIRIGPRYYSILEVCAGLWINLPIGCPNVSFLNCARTRATTQTAYYWLTLGPILHMQQRSDVSA